MAESKHPLTVSDVLQKADIALDSYDDIFSDFDFSPYEKRLLSEDFLRELNRRYSHTRKGQFVINFTLPGASRSEKTEALIRKRIKEHFKSRFKEIERKIRDKTRNGVIRVFIGVVLSSMLLVVPELEAIPALTIFYVLIWYSAWSGLENILQASSSFKKRRAFAERLTKAEYNFTSEEDVVKSLEEAQAAQKAELSPGAQRSPKSS